jgi:glycosyltransferase involved in cell wall biosynthesis
VKVAFVHDFHGSETPSGENVVVEAEVAALRRGGHDVELVALHNDELASRPLHALEGAITVATGIGRSPAAALRAFGPDIVHVHNLFPYFGNRWLRSIETPVIVTAHNFRPLCANGYLFRDGDVCTLCPDGAWWSGTRHACYRDSHLATIPLSLTTRRGVRRDPLLSRAARVLVLSERSYDVYQRAGVPPERLTLHEHFLPDALRAEPQDPGDRWVVAGRLTPEKGIDRLVADWPADRPLDVIGDGPLRGTIESAAAGTAVSVLGPLPRAEVVARMAAARGVVVASRWYETFGLVYMEAMSVGTPVVAFRPNVVADSVTRDGTGAVAAWGAVEAALDAVEAGGRTLRDHCLSVFHARYSETAFVPRRIALYEQIAAS